MYDKLKTILEDRHISRYKLAKMSDIDFSSLYSALAGKREMFPNWRARISKALEIPESDLFDDIEPTKR